jgi:exodeoxyribonuclease VII large subunit
VRESEQLATHIHQLSARMGKSLTQRLERVRNRLRLAHASYVFQRPEALLRQRRQETDDLRLRMHDHVRDRLSVARRRLDQARRAHALLSPMNRIGRARERMMRAQEDLKRAAGDAVARARARITPLLAQLDALSPLAVLSRGYALAWKLPEKTLVRDGASLAKGDTIALRFGSGGASARIESIENSQDGA